MNVNVTKMNVNVMHMLAISHSDCDSSTWTTATISQGGTPPETRLSQLHATDRATSCAKQAGQVQLSSKAREPRGIEPETSSDGSALVDAPDNWTSVPA